MIINFVASSCTKRLLMLHIGINDTKKRRKTGIILNHVNKKRKDFLTKIYDVNTFFKCKGKVFSKVKLAQVIPTTFEFPAKTKHQIA